MTFFGGQNSGIGRAGQFAQTQSRSDILGRRHQPFANPFFDHAGTYLPSTIKSLFGFCRYYHLTHGVINAINSKAASYPITDLLLQHKDPAVTAKWKELMLGVLNYRVHQVEINIDKNCYGNSFISLAWPFRKLLTCSSCSAVHDAVATRAMWRYTNHRFWLGCSKCGNTGFAQPKDAYNTKYSDIGLIRWNPEQVSIFFNEATGRSDYSMELTQGFRTQITMGRKDLVATTPEIFLQAVATRRNLVFDRQDIFHMRMPGLSAMDRGWGVPPIMPVLKDAFYLQVMKKANESVLMQHISPQVFLFPQPATAGADPFSTVDLQGWRDHIRRELARQRQDPAYYGILPFPLGHQVIGENGKSLLLGPEMRQQSEEICVGMGFPIDLLYGQANYAGASVSLRMLENRFLGEVEDHVRFTNWITHRLAAFLNWPVPEVRFKPFRMADDVQRQALLLNLAQLGKISDTAMLSPLDLTVEDETDTIMNEIGLRQGITEKQQLLQAMSAGEAAVVSAKYQARAQATLQTATAAEASPRPDPFAEESASVLRRPGAFPLDAVAAQLARAVDLMPPGQRQVYLAQLRQQVPEMAAAAFPMDQNGMPPPPSPDQQQQAGGQQQQGQQVGPGAPGIDMTPMPEKLPPRRQ